MYKHKEEKPILKDYKIKVCNDFWVGWTVKYKKKGKRFAFWKKIKVYEFEKNVVETFSVLDKRKAVDRAEYIMRYFDSIKSYHENQYRSRKYKIESRKQAMKRKKEQQKPIIFE
jgi:hypothetical protein